MFYDNLTNKYLKSLTLTKDSTISLDQVVIDIVEEKQKESLSLLELQYNKLQHDFTILSLWAGILMIVFLIFSIYSMFKVDEMQKQGRDYLNTMEGFSIEAKNISDSIEDKANEEISSLEERTTKAMNGSVSYTHLPFRWLKWQLLLRRFCHILRSSHHLELMYIWFQQE